VAEAQKKALAMYEAITASSEGRPFSFNSVEEKSRLHPSANGHSSHRMTVPYSGEVPLERVRGAFFNKLLEKMENEAAA
jgi:hypothetical protein